MLPFGFVSAPVTVYLLAKDPVIAFSIANWLSFVYGLIFCYGKSSVLLVALAFPIIALSKHLCGGATDCILRSLCSEPLEDYVGAACIAPCCHQKIRKKSEPCPAHLD